VSSPAVHELLASDAALGTLGDRAIPDDEAEQLPRSRHVIVANLRGARDRRHPRSRRLLVGQTDGGRTLTLVVEETQDPGTWVIITGRDSTAVERGALGWRAVSEKPTPSDAAEPRPGDFDAAISCAARDETFDRHLTTRCSA